MSGDDDFKPRLGRIRSAGGGRGRTYLQRVLKAAAMAGTGKNPAQAKFHGNRMGRGAGAGRVLGMRDRYAAFRSRRVLVKSRVVRLKAGGLKAAGLHLRYIQRDGVTRDGAPGSLYDRTGEGADGQAFLARADGDRHQFRFIVSPEDGTDYDDLKPFVRRLMQRIEADLGTDLDWVAVDHHNTGHPHSHIVVRGKDDRGQDLVIAREYIAHGMRERACELVTLDLGPKSDLDIEDQLRRQVEQERLTDLDRVLRRQHERDGEVRFDRDSGVDPAARAGRLQTLARLGLAEEIAPGHWHLAPDLEPTLRRLGERGDILKAMHRELARNGSPYGLADHAVFDPAAPRAEPLVGQILARGLTEGDRDSHYLVLEGVDGRAHYVDVGPDFDPRVAAGAVVAVQPGRSEPRPADLTVERVVAQHDGLYSPELHRVADPSASPDFIAAHVRRLESLRRQWRLAERQSDGIWRIGPDHARRAMETEQALGRGRVIVLSGLPLEHLPSAAGCTWLDRELVSPKPVSLGAGFGARVGTALEQRRRWLLAENLAVEKAGQIEYAPNLLHTLRERDIGKAGGDLAARLNKPFTAARLNETISGTYRQSVDLVSGRFAVVERGRDFTLVPWRPVLERHVGKPVSGIVRGETISWSFGRQRGPGVT